APSITTLSDCVAVPSAFCRLELLSHLLVHEIVTNPAGGGPYVEAGQDEPCLHRCVDGVEYGGGLRSVAAVNHLPPAPDYALLQGKGDRRGAEAGGHAAPAGDA